jgi:thioredoxin-dependent peroxiredoxin
MLNIGDQAPDFTFQSKDEVSRRLYEIEGKKIVFFYPKSFSGGCTKEVCSFRDNYEDLKSLGYEVFGISTDKISTQEKFVSKYALSYYVIADEDRKISSDYKVKFGIGPLSISKRVTYILDENNKVAYIENLGIKKSKYRLGLENHAQELISVIKEMNL